MHVVSLSDSAVATVSVHATTTVNDGTTDSEIAPGNSSSEIQSDSLALTDDMTLTAPSTA
jgi:hypothetical protein